VRCRINILQTARGVGFAIRLLSTFQATLENLNLHPDLKKLAGATNGLVLVSGSTGSGTSMGASGTTGSASTDMSASPATTTPPTVTTTN